MFKQGDRVKVVKKHHSHVGAEGTVELVYEDRNTFLVKLDGQESMAGFFGDELELVENRVRLTIEVQGSEDSSFVGGDWTPEEIETLVKFAKLVNKDAQSGLQPRIEISRDGEKIVRWDD
ncbi:hypothetical protein PBI_MIMI_265 [Arthrobacter phage Mimi]|nr:hypothetical protein PBI_MIMI_59 [Arthrobacter phage Mimi]